jgi:hypothetical protein
MKNLSVIVILAIIATSAQAQCDAYLNIGGIGSTITVDFVASGALNPQYIIEWGDGTADTSSTPFLEHTYLTDGQFVLFYTYQDLDNPNCSFSSFDSVIITGGNCSMDFTVQSISSAAIVNAFSSNTSIPIYTIDWGDGSPVDVASEALHEYAAPGNYLICVQMYDADPTLPCELYQCQNVEIIGQGAGCDVQLQVEVDVQSATALISGNTVSDAAYFIDWGDGTFDQSPVVTHTYILTGTYEACVYYGVEGNTECQSTACAEVIVDPEMSDCFFDFVPSATNLQVELDILAAGAVDPEFYFDWGDGSEGTYELPAIHTYAVAGTYQICGSYSDLSNPIACQINACASITVSETSGGCNLELSVSQNGNEVLVTAAGSGAIEPTYFIDWGDGALPLLSSTGTHTYENSGAFDLCVTYGDASNFECSATACEIIVVATTEELDELSEMKVWPNPVEDILYLEYESHQSDFVQFQLRDASGRLVYEADEHPISGRKSSVSMDFKSLPKGVYLLHCHHSEGKWIVRIIK